MKSLLPIDELNRLKQYLTESSLAGKKVGSNDVLTREKKSDHSDHDDTLEYFGYMSGSLNDSSRSAEIQDAVLDILIIAYANGYKYVNELFNGNAKPSTKQMQESVYKQVAGKNFEDRVREYTSNGDVAGIQKVAETEAERVYNEASVHAAKESGATSKTWQTMRDDRVRDTHEYLQSETVGINEMFFTYDGDSAMAPGGFNNAENNINCRCYLTFKK